MSSGTSAPSPAPPRIPSKMLEERFKRLRRMLPIKGQIAPDIVGCIGGTPMLCLRKVAEGMKAKVLLKLEYMNPGKSVKDRLGFALIEEAEAKGLISPGKSTLVEATSGNTGIALAMLGAARGYKVILTMPETMSLERRINLAVFGAQVVLTPSEHGISGANRMAERLVDEINQNKDKTGQTAYLTRQFASVANSLVHEVTTAPEIWEDTAGKVDAFVMGVGTGGTANGLSIFLKKKGSKAAIIAVEPEESPALTSKKDGLPFSPKPHLIQGIGAGFVPDVLDLRNITEIVKVRSEDALQMARRLSKEEGLLCGVSSGAIVHAALTIASRPEFEGKNIVAVVPSQGERYLTTPLFAQVLKDCLAHPVVPREEFPSPVLRVPPSLKIPAAGGYRRHMRGGGKNGMTLERCIGQTPMLYLNRFSSGLPARVALKVEFDNPGKSHGDRSALAMLLDAEAAGLLKPGDTIVEATAGDTGISLAMLAANRGYSCVICMPEHESIEKRVCITAYGARLVLTPSCKGMLGAMWKASQIAEELKAVYLNQFQSDSASRVHYETTGPEIFETASGKVDIVVLPVGSGATLTGVARYCREHHKGVKVVAVQSSKNPILSAEGCSEVNPALAISPGILIEGMDVDVLSHHTATKCEGLIDEIVTVTPAEAREAALLLPALEGVFGGISTGACAHAAKLVAARHENAGKTIVTLGCDYGDRYLSGDLYAQVQQECRDLPIVSVTAAGEDPEAPTAEDVWRNLQKEAALAARQSPHLMAYLNSRILHQSSMASAVADTIGPALKQSSGNDFARTVTKLLLDHPRVLESIAADCWRFGVIDAALAASPFKFLTQFLFYKGHHAIMNHRVAHCFWKNGDEWTALLFQSACSTAYAVDIHPGARIGRGCTVDHGTGLVIGGTAVVGRNVQFLHDITLGATGKETGDRHPKVGDDVVLGAHCQILGNILLGNGCVVAASAVVINSVDPFCTVAGIPAKVVKRSPVKQMAAFYDPKI